MQAKQRESQHEGRLRILRDRIREADQKMQAITEERNKLQYRFSGLIVFYWITNEL